MFEAERFVELPIPACRAWGLLRRSGCDVLRRATASDDAVRHTLDWHHARLSEPVDVHVSVTPSGVGSRVRISGTIPERPGAQGVLDDTLDRLVNRVYARRFAEERGNEPAPEAAAEPYRVEVLAGAAAALAGVIGVLLVIGAV